MKETKSLWRSRARPEANILQVYVPHGCFAPFLKRRQAETSICKIRLLCLSEFWTCTDVQWTDTLRVSRIRDLWCFCQQWALLSANLSGCCKVTERLFEWLAARCSSDRAPRLAVRAMSSAHAWELFWERQASQCR